MLELEGEPDGAALITAGASYDVLLDHACSGLLQLVPPSLYHGYLAMEPLVGGMLALEGDRRKHAGWLSAVNGAARRAGAMARFRVG